MTTLTHPTSLNLNREFGQMRLRFQRTLAVSIGVHVLFFAWLLIDRSLAPADEPIVEITWLDQQTLPVPEPLVVVPEEITPVPVKVEPVVAEIKPVLSVKEKLARNETSASQVREKMIALQPSSVADRIISTLPDASTSLLNTAQATMAPITRNQPPANLNRGPDSNSRRWR